MEFWRLLAHQHWFIVKLGRHELRLCARCSGYLIGIFTLVIINYFIAITMFDILPIPYQIFFCLLLVAPFLVDWLSQTMRLREGNNKVRFITGVVAGIGVYLYQSINFNQDQKVILFFYIALTTVFFYFFSKM